MITTSIPDHYCIFDQFEIPSLCSNLETKLRNLNYKPSDACDAFADVEWASILEWENTAAAYDIFLSNCVNATLPRRQQKLFETKKITFLLDLHKNYVTDQKEGQAN